MNECVRERETALYRCLAFLSTLIFCNFALISWLLGDMGSSGAPHGHPWACRQVKCTSHQRVWPWFRFRHQPPPNYTEHPQTGPSSSRSLTNHKSSRITPPTYLGNRIFRIFTLYFAFHGSLILLSRRALFRLCGHFLPTTLGV